MKNEDCEALELTWKTELELNKWPVNWHPDSPSYFGPIIVLIGIIFLGITNITLDLRSFGVDENKLITIGPYFWIYTFLATTYFLSIAQYMKKMRKKLIAVKSEVESIAFISIDTEGLRVGIKGQYENCMSWRIIDRTKSNDRQFEIISYKTSIVIKKSALTTKQLSYLSTLLNEKVRDDRA